MESIVGLHRTISAIPTGESLFIGDRPEKLRARESNPLLRAYETDDLATCPARYENGRHGRTCTHMDFHRLGLSQVRSSISPHADKIGAPFRYRTGYEVLQTTASLFGLRSIKEMVMSGIAPESQPSQSWVLSVELHDRKFRGSPRIADLAMFTFRCRRSA